MSIPWHFPVHLIVDTGGLEYLFRGLMFSCVLVLVPILQEDF